MVGVDGVGLQVAEASPQPFLDANDGEEVLKENEAEYDVRFCLSNRSSIPGLALPRTSALLSFILVVSGALGTFCFGEH